jgi:hypothetical protein
MSAATIQVWRTREKHLGTARGYRIVGKSREKSFHLWVLIINFYLFHHPIFNTWSKSHKSALFQIFPQTFLLMENLNGRHLLSVGRRLTSNIFSLKMVQIAPLNTPVPTACRCLGGPL